MTRRMFDIYSYSHQGTLYQIRSLRSLLVWMKEQTLHFNRHDFLFSKKWYLFCFFCVSVSKIYLLSNKNRYPGGKYTIWAGLRPELKNNLYYSKKKFLWRGMSSIHIRNWYASCFIFLLVLWSTWNAEELGVFFLFELDIHFTTICFKRWGHQTASQNQ